MATELLLLFALCSIIQASQAQNIYCGCGGPSQEPGVDLTLSDGASGPDVVRAVLSKIDASDVFGESSMFDQFMRRMAYVESRDGQMNVTGGIWGVSQTIFSETQSDVYMNSMQNVYTSIARCFGFNWTTLRFVNLIKPLYSGIATLLHIYYLENNLARPPFLTESNFDHGCFWFHQFKLQTDHCSESNTLIQRWIRNVSTLARNETCNVPADVVFVLDASGSISQANFNRVRNYVYNFTEALIVDTPTNDPSRVGVILYDVVASVQIFLNSTFNKSELLQMIRNLPYRGGTTNTPDGLCKLAKQPWREPNTFLRLGIVLTDGKANENSTECGTLPQAVELAKKQSILMYVIGVGNSTDPVELNLIASGPQFVDHVDTFADALDATLDARLYQFCFTTQQILEPGDVIEGPVRQQSTTRLRLRSPQGMGITIRICIKSGKVILYASTCNSIPNPSSAAHTFMVTVEAGSCFTKFFNFNQSTDLNERKRQTSSNTALYLTIEGIDQSNLSLNTSLGNVTFDVDECAQDPKPCTLFYLCVNTDGAYYCKVDYMLIIIIAAPTTAGLLLVLCTLLMLCVCCKINRTQAKAKLTKPPQDTITLKSEGDSLKKQSSQDNDSKTRVQWEYSKTKWYVK